MGTYLTAAGFQKRTLQEIRLDLEQGFRDLYGPEIDLRPEGRTGHLIGLLAKALADGWDGTAEIITSLDPSNAEGVFLDVVCALTGVFRIAAAKSRVLCACYAEAANDGLLIPAGRQVRRTRGALVFSLRTATTVSSSACRDLYIQAASPLIPGTEVTLTTSFGTFEVTVPGTSDPNMTTYQLLADAIAASAWTGTATAYSGSAPPTGAQLPEDCLRLVDPAADFGLTSSATWAASLIGSVGDFEASVYGIETVDVGEISEISTPEPGWSAVYNLSVAVPGRLAETDAQLRVRREQLFGTGNATERAILNAVYNRVDGVLSASIRSNRTMAADSDGRPPKSFEVVVQGGDATQIGQVIWDTEPAGIESYGNQTVTVTDTQGILQTVKYTIPVEAWLWVDLRYKKYGDEAFPANGESLIREAVLEWAVGEFTVGKDIFPDRVKVPVYKNVPGVGEIQVRVQVTAAGVSPTSYVSTPIEVGGRSVAVLTANRLMTTEGNFL